MTSTATTSAGASASSVGGPRGTPRRCGPRSTPRPRAPGREQVGELVGEPGRDAGALQPDAVDHARRGLVDPGRGIARPRLGRQRLHHDRAERARGRGRRPSSSPWPAVPDAVMTGLRQARPNRPAPTQVEAASRQRSTPDSPRGTPAGCGPTGSCAEAVGDAVGRGERGRRRGEQRHRCSAGGGTDVARRRPAGPGPAGEFTTSWILPVGDQLDRVDARPRDPRRTRPSLATTRLDRRRRLGLEVARRCPAVATIEKPSSTNTLGRPEPDRLVAIGQRHEHAPGGRHAVAGRELGLGERQTDA